MYENLIKTIDAAHENGLFSFVDEKRWRYTPLAKVKSDTVRQMVERYFYGSGLPMLKVRQNKKWIEEIDAVKNSHIDANGDCRIQLNLAKMLLLPGEKPKQELLELKGFLLAMKPHFEKNDDRHSDVMIFNEKENGVVVGRVSARISTTTDQEKNDENDKKDGVKDQSNLMIEDAEVTKELTDKIKASPVLQYFMKTAALSLQKMGPYSWFCFDEKHIYGEHQGPRVERLIESIKKRHNKGPN